MKTNGFLNAINGFNKNCNLFLPASTAISQSSASFPVSLQGITKTNQQKLMTMILSIIHENISIIHENISTIREKQVSDSDNPISKIKLIKTEENMI